MAFLKTAYASLVHPRVSKNQWSNIRTAGRKVGAPVAVSGNLITQASELFGVPFNPDHYLLTHATIVASVDVYEPPGVKTGSLLEDGFRVNRRYADYRIKPECDQFINNNLDAWNRDVLMKSYRTFVGAHNFLEHVQVEDLSKGRIIDAVARDIGDSIYVDILIATDRKHADLVKAIENGRLNGLSMGCTVDGTLCTKCGHWAADETEMCPHVKYAKGNVFFDDEGRKHRTAELCGHGTLGPTGGVKFIEASWVSAPAFTGAVLRNILEPSAEISRKAQKVLALPPVQWSPNATQKAASVVADGFGDPYLAGWLDDVGGGGEGEGGGEGAGEAAPAAPAAPAPRPFQDVEEALYKDLVGRVKERITKELTGPEKPAPGPEKPSTGNETIVKEGTVRDLYLTGLAAIVKTASSDAALINGVAQYNQTLGIRVPVELYRAALKVGSTRNYSTVEAYCAACRTVLQREATLAETKTLMRLSKLLSRGEFGKDGQGARR